VTTDIREYREAARRRGLQLFKSSHDHAWRLHSGLTHREFVVGPDLSWAKMQEGFKVLQPDY